jgi:hypothetical protein
MLYALGDSFTYGRNFSIEDRGKYVWPVLLGKKLDCEYVNLAEPGASNWQMARQLQSLNLNANDFVVISWSIPYRFEMCYQKIMPPLVDHSEKENVKKLAEIVYFDLFDQNWFDEMFKVFYMSCLNVLKDSGCKWVLFNSWTLQFSDDKNEEWLKPFNIPQYIFGPKRTMCEEIRTGFFQKYFTLGTTPAYWNEKEHELICDILYKKIQEIYG